MTLFSLHSLCSELCYATADPAILNPKRRVSMREDADFVEVGYRVCRLATFHKFGWAADSQRAYMGCEPGMLLTYGINWQHGLTLT